MCQKDKKQLLLSDDLSKKSTKAVVAKYDIGDIVREYLPQIWDTTNLTVHQKRMLQALSDCRTEALGTHLLACTECGSMQLACNSCRNRNCPKCQGRKRAEWIAAREAELLPVPYFHLVFTLPHQLNGLCLKYPKLMYNCLFQATWYTVRRLSKDPKWLGATTAMTAVLHTWGSNMSLHPHLHCIVPGGGLTDSGEWKTARSNGNYLFNRHVMGLIFRARFVKLLRALIDQKAIPSTAIEKDLFKNLFAKEWITYAKRPFIGPKAVVEYLGRYTHKIAISNHRITKVTKTHVHFRYKNYQKEGKAEEMILTKWEFIRRFALHIVPHKFVRIRHYGFLANRNKKQYLAQARRALQVMPPTSEEENLIPAVPPQVNQQLAWCGTCQKVTIQQILEVIAPPVRGSPTKV